MIRTLEVTRTPSGEWLVTRETTGSLGELRPSDPQRVLFLRRNLPTSVLGLRYDPRTDTFGTQWEPPPAPPEPLIPSSGLTPLQFRWRFSEDEQVSIELAKEAHPVPAVRAALRVLDINIRDTRSPIKLDDPRTIGGVRRLATLRLISDQRADEILDDSWTPPWAPDL